MRIKEKTKRVNALLERLRQSCVFVEGKRDKIALLSLGCLDVKTISGNLRLSADALAGEILQGKRPADAPVVILTDFDRRGGQLAEMARGELESRSIRADLHTRKEIGSLLRIKFFEDFRRLYDKMIEEGESNG